MVEHAHGSRRADPGPEQAGVRERVEAFVVRTALDADGTPQRSRVIHVRSHAELSSRGWQPDEIVLFMEDCLRLAPTERRPAGTAVPPLAEPAHRATDLDVGIAIGGREEDVELTVVTSGRSSFTYTAALGVRPYGRDTAEDGAWVTLATQQDAARAGARLDLCFVGVRLPAGLQRLRLRVMTRSSGHGTPPDVALARRSGQA